MSFNIPTMSPASSHAGRSRSNSYSSSVKELQAGTKVLIIETENVMQRARHLVGKVGSICEVPVHPATWYKVQFPDNSITTFRPSAFRIVGSDHDIEPFDLPANFSLSQPFLKSFKFTEKPAKPTRQRLSGNSTDLDAIDDEISVGDFESVATGTTATGHNEDASVSGASVPNDSQIKQKPLLLDNLDPDIWVGCTIKIVAGKNVLDEGRVVRTGNGWVQVVTSQGEEVAKRAHELEVLALPVGINRPINTTRTPTAANARRKQNAQQMGSNVEDVDRPRRIGKKSSDSDGISGIAMTRHDDCEEYTIDAAYLAKELKKSINFENFSCWNRSQRDEDNLYNCNRTCRHCLLPLDAGSKFCWNDQCSTSPSYFSYALAVNQKQLVSKKTLFPILDTPSNVQDVSVGDKRSLPTQSVKVEVTPMGLPPSSYIPSSGQLIPATKKRRSDSSLTDEESLSPEISAIGNEAMSAMMNDSSFTAQSLLLPASLCMTNPSLLNNNPTMKPIINTQQLTGVYSTNISATEQYLTKNKLHPITGEFSPGGLTEGSNLLVAIYGSTMSHDKVSQ